MTATRESETTPTPIEVLEFATADEFLAALRPSNPRWLAPYESQVRWVFRGLRDHEWGLVPSAWRSDCAQHPAYKRALNDAAIPMQTTQELHRGGVGRPNLSEEELQRRVATVVVQRQFEHTVIDEFAKLLDELGMPIPDGSFPDGYFWDYFYFVCGPSLCRRHDIDVPMTHALAQHHRTPTRLLDWTANPLYAAFFAASDPIVTKAERLAVWAAHRDDFRTPEWQWSSGGTGSEDYGRVETGWRLLTYPRHHSSFMHAQSGAFTFFSNAGYHYLLHGEWPDMRTVHRPQRLRQLTLPSDQIPELLRLLHAERISKAHLMPHLDNISDALNDNWKAMLTRLQGTVDAPRP